MRTRLFLVVSLCLFVGKLPASAQEQKTATPGDGYTVHVSAPHVVDGKIMGPFHHYCKVHSPDPVIVCLIFDSTDANAKLTQVEYIIAKKITRANVPLADWNKNWHDHRGEIATGRVQVHDLPPDDAKKVADLVATTDGIIFSLWKSDDAVPSGKVTIPQAVGHKVITDQEFKAGAQDVAGAKK